jgi:hypothetical protein
MVRYAVLGCLCCVQDFGKFGFIRESDMAAKQSEFMLWATEVKGANVELLGRMEEKELFKEYMEDFNTGTLKNRSVHEQLDSLTSVSCPSRSCLPPCARNTALCMLCVHAPGQELLG